MQRERRLARRHLHGSGRLLPKRDAILQHVRDADVRLELHLGYLLLRVRAGMHAERDPVRGQWRADVQFVRSVGQRGGMPRIDSELQRRELRAATQLPAEPRRVDKLRFCVRKLLYEPAGAGRLVRPNVRE